MCGKGFFLLPLRHFHSGQTGRDPEQGPAEEPGGAEVHRAAPPRLRHKVRHQAVGGGHRMAPTHNMDEQNVVPQVWSEEEIDAFGNVVVFVLKIIIRNPDRFQLRSG